MKRRLLLVSLALVLTLMILTPATALADNGRQCVNRRFYRFRTTVCDLHARPDCERTYLALPWRDGGGLHQPVRLGFAGRNLFLHCPQFYC